LSIRFFFSSRRRHTRSKRDWSSDVCSSDLHDHHVDLEANTGSAMSPEINVVIVMPSWAPESWKDSVVCARRTARARRSPVRAWADRKSVVEGKRGEAGGGAGRHSKTDRELR